MKKILAVLFILSISTQVFAKLKPKQFIGKWNYTVVERNRLPAITFLPYFPFLYLH